MNDARPPSALTIAGSDSGGGAGIQADLKTFAAHRVHGLCAIAALTAQNTRGVSAVHVPDVGFLRAQIDACFDDFDVVAVKLGMLATSAVIDAVADALETHKPRNVVLDPVMVATSGARLLQPDALDALRSRLLPLANVITPNLPEAELLLGRPIQDHPAMLDAVRRLRDLGAPTVLLKGGHLHGSGAVVDLFADDSGVREIAHPRLPIEAHGTGCTLASAIAATIANGLSVGDAVKDAQEYTWQTLKAAFRPGMGQHIPDRLFWAREDEPADEV